jgi:hypothetical protein
MVVRERKEGKIEKEEETDPFTFRTNRPQYNQGKKTGKKE